MPWVKQGKDEPERYRLPVHIAAVTWNEEHVAWALNWRKQLREDREECLKAQKEAAKAKDYDLARYWSDVAKQRMTDYRAICLVLGHIGWDELPGDCEWRDYLEWPKELAPICDRYFDYMLCI